MGIYYLFKYDPAVVAWSIKAIVFHSVNSSPEQAVVPISKYGVLIVQKWKHFVAIQTAERWAFRFIINALDVANNDCESFIILQLLCCMTGVWCHLWSFQEAVIPS